MRVVPEAQADDVRQRLEGLGERAYVIGRIERKEPDEESLLLDPSRESNVPGKRRCASRETSHWHAPLRMPRFPWCHDPAEN